MTATRKEFSEPEANNVEAVSSPHEGQDYALVVGVNDYPQLRPLRGAIADARAFADWLIEPLGGRVPMANVRTIVSASNPLSPIVHEINEALLDVLERAGKNGGQRFYFYFSGHGCVGDRSSDLALCMANWSDLRRRAALSSEAWLDIVVRSGVFAEVAFFLDCCRVWATRAVGLPPDIDFAKPVERPHPTRIFLAYATEFQRPAMEVHERSAVGELDEVRGIFTQVLLDGLRGEAAGRTGEVTAGSLKEYAEFNTERRAKSKGFHQRAEILHGFDSHARFGFFARNQDGPTPPSGPTHDPSSPTVTLVNRGDTRCLTIVYHPKLDRVGERAFLDESSDKPMVLSRFEPEFVAPGASNGEPLNDAAISRTPIHFIPTGDGGVSIDIGKSATPVSISGQRITGSVALSADDVTRGVVLALGQRVVLLLQSVNSGARRLGSVDSSIAPEMIGSSVGLRRVRLEIQNVADTDNNVLIRGETGTGKELVAHAIHRVSSRRDKPFVAVNVAGVPEALAEAEFFGSDKGHFSRAPRSGYFEQAEGGTLFLDEIGDIPMAIQAKFSRALDMREIQPIGLQQSRKVNVRIIAATDAGLTSLAGAARFSDYLLARVNGYELGIPPLRERREDIGLLLAHFLREELAAIGDSRRLDVNDDAYTPWLPASIVAQLIDYDWPGNIRELKNVVGQIVLSNLNRERVKMPPAVERRLATQSLNIRSRLLGPVTYDSDIVPSIRIRSQQLDIALETPLSLGRPQAMRRPADVTENELREALRASRWDLNAASKQLGISRASMYVLKERFGWFRVAGDLKVDEILQCHDACNGNLNQMAERLEVSEASLRRRMRELGLSVPVIEPFMLPAIEPPATLTVPVSTAPQFDDPDAQSRLVIEFRNQPTGTPTQNARWLILMGEEFLEIDADSIRRSNDNKSASFSARMRPGSFIVRYEGNQSRDLGLSLYPQWTTHVMIDDAFHPHFETMRIFLLPRVEALIVEAEIIRAIKLGFALLSSGVGDSPTILSRIMQGDSFDNPMLGLIAAHLLAREKKPDAKCIQAIATRLETLLGPCPDVLALQLRAALIQGGALPSISANNPPMLREGLLAFVEASHQEPQCIPSQSLLEYACVERLVDSPFSSWSVRNDQQVTADWLTTALEELDVQHGAELDATKVAREFGVPTLAVVTRIEAMRHRQ